MFAELPNLVHDISETEALGPGCVGSTDWDRNLGTLVAVARASYVGLPSAKL